MQHDLLVLINCCFQFLIKEIRQGNNLITLIGNMCVYMKSIMSIALKSVITLREHKLACPWYVLHTKKRGTLSWV